MRDDTLPKRRQWRRIVAGVEGQRVEQVKRAIPVYAVDSMADALFLQTTTCVKRWDGSFAYSEGVGLTGDDGRRVLEPDDLEGITEKLHALHQQHLAAKAAREPHTGIERQ